MIEIKDHVNGQHVYLDRQSLRSMLTSAYCYNADSQKKYEDTTFAEILGGRAGIGQIPHDDCAIRNHIVNWNFCEARRVELGRLTEALEFDKQQKRTW